MDSNLVTVERVCESLRKILFGEDVFLSNLTLTILLVRLENILFKQILLKKFKNTIQLFTRSFFILKFEKVI